MMITNVNGKMQYKRTPSVALIDS